MALTVEYIFSERVVAGGKPLTAGPSQWDFARFNALAVFSDTTL